MGLVFLLNKKMDQKSVELLSDKIVEKGRNVFFTGAGISTESGIRDYRSQGGIWKQFKPVYIDEFMSDKSARIEYWKRKTFLYDEIKNAKPNAAHLALKRLNDLGLLEVVITQNIDGLHQKAGLSEEKIIELHGNSLRIRCMTCSKISALESAILRIKDGDLAPECECGGFLKPDTISFGQAMPEKKVSEAFEFASNSSNFVVVGSTLLVQPAASIPFQAKQNNAFFAIINLSETPLDSYADILIKEKAGTIMQMLINCIEKHRI